MKQSLRANGHTVAKRPLNGDAATPTLSRKPSSPLKAEALVASHWTIVRDMLIVEDATSELQRLP